MYDHDHWHQVNRIGHVLLPHLYLDTDEHNKSENEGRPVTDHMRRAWVKDVIQNFATTCGGQKNPSEYAENMAQMLLPDVVPYTIGTEAHYGVHHFNGRKLSDYAMDTAVHFLCGRQVEDYVRPTSNYTNAFPYLVPSNV